MAAAASSPTLSNAPEKPSGRANGVPINSTGAGADPASNVTLRALVSTKEGRFFSSPVALAIDQVIPGIDRHLIASLDPNL